MTTIRHMVRGVGGVDHMKNSLQKAHENSAHEEVLVGRFLN